MLNTKTKIKDYFSNNYPYFPHFSIPCSEKMTQRQRLTLVNLIYEKVLDPEAVNERLIELESFTQDDARENIKELLEV
ncbi:MAG: hypothetical protein NTU76_03795 [Candidatus Taylorbacteria bacterium]|nr:hypothetical protein [Candidatus Taylorbacteria bacterium]